MIDLTSVSIETFSLILFMGAILAGMVGALTGLGGGVVVIPLLTLGFGVDMRYAVGAALVTSIATSSGAAAAYIRERITNVRIGMFLEMATTVGAVVGALVAMYMPTNVIAILFGTVLIFSAAMSLRKKNQTIDYSLPGDKLGVALKLNGSYPTADGVVTYNVRRVFGGFSLMTLSLIHI